MATYALIAILCGITIAAGYWLYSRRRRRTADAATTEPTATTDTEAPREPINPVGLVATGPYPLETEPGEYLFADPRHLIPARERGIDDSNNCGPPGVRGEPGIPDRERRPVGGNLDNEGFFDQLRAEATARAEAQPDPNLHQLARGFDMPGIRLPKPNKAAFASEDLIAQQSDMRTHDHGLQVVLDALHMVVKTFAGCEHVPLRDYRFNMNFATAASTNSKRFVARMKSPITCQIELIQEMHSGSFHPTWRAVIDGQDITFDSESDIRVTTETRRPQGREERAIEFRD